jgi:hypothetical protein
MHKNASTEGLSVLNYTYKWEVSNFRVETSRNTKFCRTLKKTEQLTYPNTVAKRASVSLKDSVVREYYTMSNSKYRECQAKHRHTEHCKRVASLFAMEQRRHPLSDEDSNDTHTCTFCSLQDQAFLDSAGDSNAFVRNFGNNLLVDNA